KKFTLPFLKCTFVALILLIPILSKAQTYCTPSYCCGTASSGAMSNFSLTGYAGSTISDALSYTSNYYDRTATVSVCNLQQGGSYPCTITYASATNYTDNQIFIDFNDDGVFDTTAEKV